MTTHQGDISGRLLCRRAFLSCAAGSTLGLTLGSRIQASETLPAGDPSRARTLTRPPGHHFFGYYDKCPWDRTGRYVLGMRSDFMDRQPRPGEELTIGLIDTRENDRFVPLDRTPAWSWQQGTMLQWLGPAADRRMIYNSLDGGRYVSIVRDVRSGETRRLPRPIYAVSRDGRQAVTLDFDRVNRMRPGYGYVALPERCADQPAPAEAGIYWMDLDRGDSRLILSIASAAAHRPDERFDGAAHWFNHLQFNPSGTRFIFLHRWRTAGGNRWWTRLYTAAPDGSDVRLLSDAGMVSHFDWQDDRTILAWARTREAGDHFYRIDDETARHTVFAGDVLRQDGHCSFSPDRRWLLTDTYPDKNGLQTLILYRIADARRFDIGRFFQPPELRGKPWRCDLHPRWNRDGTEVCIDSTHEGSRQMYVIDVRSVVRA